MNPPFDNLGERVQALRHQLFTSQQAFANRCHELGVPITRAMIADWETDRSEIPAQLIPFLAHALNARVADLLPSFHKATISNLPPSLPPPPVGKELKVRIANGAVFATCQLSLENALRDFDRIPCRFAPVNSEQDRLNPFDRLVWHENRALLMSLLRALNRNHRQVILLRYYGCLTIPQIAAKLNRSVSLVTIRLIQGREKLRRLLNCDCGQHWLRREFREQFPPLEKES
ncbi:MAG: sigma factor-like helix-turn-helix DNA-binding protein [Limisphaerales bacterium]